MSFGFRIVSGLVVLSMCMSAASGCAQDKARQGSVVARVGDRVITEEELGKAAAADLDKLEIQRLQYEATYARSRHQALQTNLERMLEQRLLEAAAAKLGVPASEVLTKALEGKNKEPTEEEINAFYEANKARVNQPKEKVALQIRQYLQRQAASKARKDYIESLKEEYGAVSYLEPYRVTVASAGYPSTGPAQAPVLMVEFSDFECSYCKALSSTLKEVLKNFPTQVRLVYRQFPLDMHPSARKAAEASLCAAEQGRFWELHDAMLADQAALGVEDLKKKAAGLKLDAAAFNTCLDSGKHADSINRELRDGYRAGVSGTPALFINGRFVSGAQPYAELVSIIEDELKRKAGSAK